MKIVIDISKEQYEIIKELVKNQNRVCPEANSAEKIILNGTPLPKGHGRLIDEKEACGIIAWGKDDKAYFGEVSKDWEVIDFLKTVPTIIEAESEDKE